MTEVPISTFPIPDLDDVPDDLRTMMLGIQDKTGFIPNVFLALAHRPDELRAFMAYHEALMEGESGLTKAEREMIVVATSGSNSCMYCVIAHGAILRIRAKDPLIADQLAVDPLKADLDDRQLAMIAFAVKLARTPEDVQAADHLGEGAATHVRVAVLENFVLRGLLRAPCVPRLHLLLLASG